MPRNLQRVLDPCAYSSTASQRHLSNELSRKHTFMQLIDGLCNQSVTSFVAVWQLTTAMAVIIMVLAVLGIYLVRYSIYEP